MMSRNIQQKARPAPAKVQRRRRCSDSSSSLDLSGDTGYSGVEDVSDSEDDDEEDVNAAEEEHIITHELQPMHSLGSPRPVQEDDEDADEEDENDEDDDYDDQDDNCSPWNGIVSEAEDSSSSNQNYHVQEALHFHEEQQDLPAVERHVRFAGVPDSDSDSTTSETSDHHDFFPDIFVEQTALDPSFRREIEHESDSSNSGSFWDYHEAYETGHNPHAVPSNMSVANPSATQAARSSRDGVWDPLLDQELDQEFDGYETDGDTTEEEDVPEPPARKKATRRVQVVETSDSDTDKPAKPNTRGKPRVGRFHLDNSSTKPIAVLNPITRKMMIFTPQQLRRLDLSPESFNFDLMPQSSPILSNSASLMIGAMMSSQTFGDYINTQPVGPAEAFFATNDSDAFLGLDSDQSEYDVPTDEAEERLNWGDLISWGKDDSGDEGGEDEELGWGDEASVGEASTPARRPSTAAMSTTSDANLDNPDVHPLLTHFDGNSGAVGAFRLNQVNQQLILSDKATKESLAFSNTYSMGTLRGVRSDSLGNITAPLTPARRRKRSMGGGVFEHIDSSPLDSVTQKRKASAAIGEGLSHKKHRSISDVQGLQI